MKQTYRGLRYCAIFFYNSQRYPNPMNVLASPARNKKPLSDSNRGFRIEFTDINYTSTAGCTDTKDLFSLPFLNTTTPFVNAKRVWSLPIPTFLPG